MLLKELLTELQEAAARPERSTDHLLTQFLSSLGRSTSIYLGSDDSAPQQFLQKACAILAEKRPEVLMCLGATLLNTTLTLESWPVTPHFALLPTLAWCADGEGAESEQSPPRVGRIHLLPRTTAARDYIVARRQQAGGRAHGEIVRVRIRGGGWVEALQLPQDCLTFLEVRQCALVTSSLVD